MSVARLQLGQRVYVLRNESGEAVGAWGTVVRECFRQAVAWVRLDERHARCPFPADAEHRATWILTLPEHCSSVAPVPASCRRCVECVGEAHHWLTSMPECPEDGGEPFIPCKHCDARAGLCDECGEGPVWPPTANNQRCELCNAPGGV